MSLRVVALFLFTVGVESFSRRRHGSNGGYSRRRMRSYESYGGSANSCSGEFSAGPEDADVEITVGNLPASTSYTDVVLYWRAARKSTTDYDPLVNPGAAQVYSGACKAYASPGDADWNGGKVVVSRNGTAKIRVQAPATYSGWHSGSSRVPHVHFGFCEGAYARSMKLAFGPAGVYISSGCGSASGSSGSYTILEVKSLSTATMLTPSIAPVVTSTTTTSTAAAVTILKEDPEEKDWDALEFSPVYQCIMEQEDSVYDHFASDCVGECPGDSELKHRQCVRPSGAVQQPMVLAATWRLHLECDDKCWAEAVNITMHFVRLALADHLDVPFQEAKDVRLWKDEGAPATHAHLQVQVLTDRLDAKQGRPLLQSFLTNATFASEMMGLTVLETPDIAPDMEGAPTVSSVSPEKPDQYDQYYGMLEKKRDPTVIAGVYIPEEVPVPVIVSAAVGVILLGSVVALFLHFRRKRHHQLREAAAAAANLDAKVVEGKIPEDDAPVKIPGSMDADVEEGKLPEDSNAVKIPASVDADIEEGKLPEDNDPAKIPA